MCQPVSSRKNDYNTVLRLVVTRRWFHEVINVIGITSLLTALSLTTFTNPPEHVGDRLTVVLTLTLTVVANKNNTASYIPHVPYATCIDYFFWLASTFMAFVACMASWPANWCYHNQPSEEGREEDETHEARLLEIAKCFDDVLFDGSDVRNFQICSVLGVVLLMSWLATAWLTRRRVRRKAGLSIDTNSRWKCFSFVALKRKMKTEDGLVSSPAEWLDDTVAPSLAQRAIGGSVPEGARTESFVRKRKSSLDLWEQQYFMGNAQAEDLEYDIWRGEQREKHQQEGKHQHQHQHQQQQGKQQGRGGGEEDKVPAGQQEGEKGEEDTVSAGQPRSPKKGNINGLSPVASNARIGLLPNIMGNSKPKRIQPIDDSLAGSELPTERRTSIPGEVAESN
jgi:hypothetical protein